MPRFKKQILPEGQYLVLGNDQKRKLVQFDAKKLNTISENSQKMVEAGLRIPAPFKHLKEAVPVTEIPENSSFDNGGYWDKFWTETDEKGKVSLWGEIDAPGEQTDFNSPAGKIQNTIKEVSACVVDEWTDGVGRKWGPCVAHGALVVHPVVPGQKEFSLVDDNAVALSVSGMVTSISPGDIAELSRELSTSAGIFLDPATLLEDLPKTLMIALKQHKLSTQDDDDDSEVVQQQPIFMSLTTDPKEMPITKKEAEHLLQLGAINPKTNKPFTIDEFQIADDPRDALNLSLLNNIKDSTKEGLKRRAEALVADGRLTKEFAEKTVYPQIESIDLSLIKFDKDNKVEPTQVEMFILNAESMPVPGKPANDPTNLNLTGDEVVHTPPVGQDGQQTLTAEQQNALIKEMLGSMV